MNNPDLKSKLHLKSHEILRTEFAKKPGIDNYNLNIDVKQRLNTSPDNPNQFQIFFFVKIESKDPSSPFIISVETISFFEMENVVNPEVERNFKEISAPSIIFPILRAYVANLSMNAGMNPIYLPIVSFQRDFIDSSEEE